MAKEKYRISKVSSKVESDDFWYEPDYWTVGYYITLSNVNNPFDYFTQYVPKEAYSKEEFAVGREIEMEADRDALRKRNS